MTRQDSSPLFRHSFRLVRPSFTLGACMLFAALSACSSSPPLFLRDGRPTIQVQCPAAGDRESCAQQARARCGGPYDTVGSSTEGANFNLIFACRAQ
jgi:hypothetical protein